MLGDSKLVSYVCWSPNVNKPRNHDIDTVSIHVMAGDISIETCGNIFQTPGGASSQYGIETLGRIGQYARESWRTWCTSSYYNDHRAITIEVANDGGAETGWHISPKAYDSLINLLVDICQRNPGIHRLKWQADPNLIGHTDLQNMTVHRWFDNKSCPGDYLYNLHGQIARTVNRKLEDLEDENMTKEKFAQMYQEMRKDWEDNDASNYSEEARNWSQSIGLVSGVSGKEFNGAWQDVLTREQLVTILYKFTKMLKEGTV